MTYSSEVSERLTLCSLFCDPLNNCSAIVEHKITPDHFFSPPHRYLFESIMEVWSSGKSVELGLIYETLVSKGVATEIGGYDFVAGIYGDHAISDIVPYLSVLQDWHVSRGIFKTCSDGVTRSSDPTEDKKPLLGAILSDLEALNGHVEPAITLKSELLAYIGRMEANEANPDLLKTGLSELDRKSPIKRGNMPLITGQTKSGKSMLALTVALNLAINEREPVIIFSLEDPLSEVCIRMIENVSRVPRSLHHKSSLTEMNMAKIVNAMEKLSNAPILVRDDVFDLAGIMAVSRQYRTRNPSLALIVVDYAQLVKADIRKTDNREQEVAKVSRGLRILSMEKSSSGQRAAVAVISQLNDNGESRESRALQQDCTAKINVTRLKEDHEDFNRKRFISVPYQRNGEGCVGFEAAFFGHISRFDNLAE